MQKIFLTSNLGGYRVNKEGIKEAIALDNNNGLITQLKNKLIRRNNLVFCASSPSQYNKTDMYANLIFESLKLSGIGFHNLYVIDNRLKENLK